MGGDRDIRLLTGAVFLSALGDWLALVPLALHLEETTSSGIAVAGLPGGTVTSDRNPYPR